MSATLWINALKHVGYTDEQIERELLAAERKPVTRDITHKRFLKICKRRGIEPDHFGYWRVAPGVLVHVSNGGHTRRDRLAYLIRQQQAHLGDT